MTKRSMHEWEKCGNEGHKEQCRRQCHRPQALLWIDHTRHRDRQCRANDNGVKDDKAAYRIYSPGRVHVCSDCRPLIPSTQEYIVSTLSNTGFPIRRNDATSASAPEDSD